MQLFDVKERKDDAVVLLIESQEKIYDILLNNSKEISDIKLNQLKCFSDITISMAEHTNSMKEYINKKHDTDKNSCNDCKKDIEKKLSNSLPRWVYITTITILMVLFGTVFESQSQRKEKIATIDKVLVEHKGCLKELDKNINKLENTYVEGKGQLHKKS